MKFFWTICIFVLAFFCVNHVYAQNSSFISRKGIELTRNNQPFRFVGANRYNLLTTGGNPYRGCGGSWTEANLDQYFSELQSNHIQVIRFWIFQGFTDNGSFFGRMDYLVNLASKYNILLLPVFENHWSACTQGGNKSATWYSSGYKNTYGFSKTLKEYISIVVNRYKNSPQIFAWQIMNEAESSDGQALVSFADDIGRYIKSLDTNHLVSFGTLGSSQNGMSMYTQIHSSPGIDLLEYHDYDYDCCNTLYPTYLDTRIANAKTLQKPLFVGEAGIKVGCSGCISTTTRADVFDKKLQDFFNKGGSGYLIWSYRDNVFNQSSDNFAFTTSDPLVSVIKKYSVIGTPQPTSVGKSGDGNNDGKVDGKDYVIWLIHYGQMITGKQNGDYQNDGKVDGKDYVIWLLAYGK